jgi:hypothetical protein
VSHLYREESRVCFGGKRAREKERQTGCGKKMDLAKERD